MSLLAQIAIFLAATVIVIPVFRRLELELIIAGFGRFGQIVGRILRARRIAFAALEAKQIQVDFLRNFGRRMRYQIRESPR